MTPLAVVANAARTGRLPPDNGAPTWLAHPLASLGASALAAYELAGDKQKSAPDRIIIPALVVRAGTAAFAAVALSPRGERLPAAAVAGAVAVASAFLTWSARMQAMRRWSQLRTGLVEDAIVVPTAIAAAGASLPRHVTT